MKLIFKDGITNKISGGVLHVDTKGCINDESVCGYNYFETIVEAKTRHVVVHCVKDKAALAGERIKYVHVFES